MSTPTTVPAATLQAFQQLQQPLSEQLSRAMGCANRFIHCSVEQQHTLARLTISATASALEQQSPAPLLALATHASLQPIAHRLPALLTLFDLARQTIWEVLSPAVVSHPTREVALLQALTDTLAQATLLAVEQHFPATSVSMPTPTIFHELGHQLNRTRTLQDVVDVIVQHLVPLGAADCYLITIKKNAQGNPSAIELAAGWKRDGDFAPLLGQHFAPHAALMELVLSPELILIEDSASDTQIDEGTRTLLLDNQQLSQISIPLIHDDQLIGRLIVSWPQAHRFISTELQLVDAIIAQSPALIERLQLYEELRIFYALAENAPDAIGIADLQGITTYANPSYQTLTGYGEHCIGQPVEVYFAEDEKERLPEIIGQVLTHNRWRGIITMRRSDGTTLKGQVSAFTISNAQGQPLAIASITRDITAERRHEEELRTFYALADNAPDGIVVANLEGTITYINRAFHTMVGYGPEALQMKTTDFVLEAPEQVYAIARHVSEHGVSQDILTYQRKDGTTFPGQLTGFMIYNHDHIPIGMAAIVRDLTDQIRLEQERLRLQEEVIEAQQATLRELSTPLIPLSDQVVVMPLIGSMDSSRAQQVLDTLLQGVSSHKATTAILDITGVPVVDTQVANTLLRAAQTVKLLGAQVIITGIRPEVAQMLIRLGIDLSGIITRSSLQRGIAFALQQMTGS